MVGFCECGRPLYAKGVCHICYNAIWKKNHTHETREQNKHASERYRLKKYKEQTCEIIKQHHEAMKDDPEHLTTEFIKKLIKVDCKEV